MADELEGTDLLRIREVVNLTKISRASIYRLLREDRFPKPIRLGISVVWDAGEVKAHIDNLMAARR